MKNIMATSQGNANLSSLSIVHGPTVPELSQLTLGQLVDQQAERYGNKDCLVFPWSQARLSFSELCQRSKKLANGLLAMNICKGDRVAIFSSDDERFIELFFAVGRIGAIIVILNKTYTAVECERAIKYTG
jgi:acyl-CoA synthetase (AMP-forming)/AMP-acid ligase II